VIDLRYKMNELIKAPDLNEEVAALYHGKVKGVIVPARESTKKKNQGTSFFCYGKGCSKNSS